MNIQSLIRLISCMAITALAAVIGSAATFPAIDSWYATVQKPLFTPPNWLFGPVWTILYFLMAFALYLYWNSKQSSVKLTKGLTVYGLQLVLNTIWSLLFFGARSPGLALLEIVLLWSTIVWTITVFGKVSKTASILLIPYVVWVSFAAALNLAIVLLNS